MTFLQKLIRLPLRFIPANLVVTILFGSLKGTKWITGSSNHGYWLGWYERPLRRLLQKHLKPGMIFFDLGAHVGYYSLLGAKCVGSNGRVYAFEPHPVNISFIKRHVNLNNISNVILIEGAVSTFEGEYYLSNQSRVGAKLSEKGSIPVQVFSLKSMFQNGTLPLPHVMKIDIEGTEYKLLCDNIEMLRQHKPVLFLSTHGNDIHHKCIYLLRDLNYIIEPLDGPDIYRCTELGAYP